MTILEQLLSLVYIRKYKNKQAKDDFEKFRFNAFLTNPELAQKIFKEKEGVVESTTFLDNVAKRTKQSVEQLKNMLEVMESKDDVIRPAQ